MERESFCSLDVAQLLNAHFIPVKIDREERPDVDAIYMNYVQATTGSGGWPLNVFITPGLEPVFGGTYWPGPNNSMTAVGTAVAETVGFVDILEKMRDVWTQQEDRCRESAKEITRQLRDFAEEGVHSHQMGEKGEGEGLEVELLEEAFQHFRKKYDKINGGFSTAPKFPTPVHLSFLLRLRQWPQTVTDVVGETECQHASNMALHTLRNMARGGIRDQIGYGFARYSVTKDWSLPHFEKMLYDQAQLLDVYLDAFLSTRDPEMLGAVYDIATYLTSPPMGAPNGGFFSAEDADSYPSKGDNEKREGAYYVWSLKEFHDVLGKQDGDTCARFYGVTADGNVASQNDPHDEFISQNVLNVTTTPVLWPRNWGFPRLRSPKPSNLDGKSSASTGRITGLAQPSTTRSSSAGTVSQSVRYLAPLPRYNLWTLPKPQSAWKPPSLPLCSSRKSSLTLTLRPCTGSTGKVEARRRVCAMIMLSSSTVSSISTKPRLTIHIWSSQTYCRNDKTSYSPPQTLQASTPHPLHIRQICS